MGYFRPGRPAPADAPASSDGRAGPLPFAAGNRAVAGLIASIQRAVEPRPATMDANAGGVFGPLGPGQVADALAYYRTATWLTPQLMAQVRRALSLLAGDTADEALVQAVAAKQLDLGGSAARQVNDPTLPALRVDGKLDKLTLGRLLGIGLASAAVEQTYVRTARARVLGGPHVRSPAGWLTSCGGAVDDALTAAGVPTAGLVAVGEAGVRAAHFDRRQWQIAVYPGPLAACNRGPEGPRQLLFHLFHEARHAEQAFAVARLMAGTDHLTHPDRRRSPAEISASVAAIFDVPAQVADRAVTQPLDLTNLDGIVAFNWLMDLAPGASNIEEVVTEAAAAAVMVQLAERTYRREPTPEHRRSLDHMRARLAETLLRYYSNPVENDAQWAAEQMEDRLDAPPPAEEALPPNEPTG
jgi:hypothetical protein